MSFAGVAASENQIVSGNPCAPDQHFRLLRPIRLLDLLGNGSNQRYRRSIFSTPRSNLVLKRHSPLYATMLILPLAALLGCQSAEQPQVSNAPYSTRPGEPSVEFSPSRSADDAAALIVTIQDE